MNQIAAATVQGNNEHSYKHTEHWKLSFKVTLALTELPAGFTHPIAPAALITMSAQPTNELTVSITETGMISFYVFQLSQWLRQASMANAQN